MGDKKPETMKQALIGTIKDLAKARNAISGMLVLARERYDVYTRTDDNDDLYALGDALSVAPRPIAVLRRYLSIDSDIVSAIGHSLDKESFDRQVDDEWKENLVEVDIIVMPSKQI